MELWDAYDKDMKIIPGTARVREEPRPAGYVHLVCEIIVRHRDGEYLLMQRDPQKHFGGMWEATTGGSALQGESPAECALRELREEPGIIPESLTDLGRVIHYQHKTIYAEYLCVTSCAKNSVTLQPGETVAYKWVTPDDLCHMSRRELVTQRIQNFIGEPG